MTPLDRAVRAAIFRLLVDGVAPVDDRALAGRNGWDTEEVARSLARLADEHRIALTAGGAVWMAHPFSGVPTSYRARVAGRTYYANCAWDALAILSMLGDGAAIGPDRLEWRVVNGRVEPNGLVHLLVPARDFWADIGFT
jgi:Alkylmercury lyase